jgi:hypothetical protein
MTVRFTPYFVSETTQYRCKKFGNEGEKSLLKAIGKTSMLVDLQLSIILARQQKSTQVSYVFSKQDRKYAYKRNIEACSRNHCCRGRAVSIT